MPQGQAEHSLASQHEAENAERGGIVQGLEEHRVVLRPKVRRLHCGPWISRPTARASTMSELAMASRRPACRSLRWLD